jgi:hypothetical protein
VIFAKIFEEYRDISKKFEQKHKGLGAEIYQNIRQKAFVKQMA